MPIFIVEKWMDYSFPLHYHNFAELSLVVEGTGTEILNGNPHRFRRGTITFLLPHHMHEIVLDHPNVHKYNCMFDLSLLFLNLSDCDLTNRLLKIGSELPAQYDLNEGQTEYMIRLFHSMKQEYENDDFAKDTVLRSKLMEALAYLMRILLTRAITDPDSGSGEGRGMVQQLLQYLHTHYQEDISLVIVAKHFNWNASYISRVFKQHVGQTFTDYLHSLRIARATSLLASTTMRIMDISVEVGFDQVRTMSRVFKELMGVTPREFRNRYE
jgi:AraC-like DNA-binding protein